MLKKETLDQYRPTIGIECHVQLRTKTKLFSGANNDARDQAPNTTVSPICFGLPGVLPVLNAEAITLAIRAGIALNAEIARVSSFDRKHYFYPDLPLGYQITQLERPIVGVGKIAVPLKNGETFDVRITRAHLESDAGKLTHPTGADYSLVDLNRAGTPLIEIVSEPDMHSPEEARAYAQELYLLMTYADVTYGDLYHGNMRFDVNISVAKKDSPELGTRAEVKNLNSFRSVEKAAEYEFLRQVELLEKGEVIAQETRGWHDDKQKTFSQRSKEDAHDYRYFPDADIPPVEVTDAQITEIRNTLPMLPPALRDKFQQLGVDWSVIQALLATKPHADAVATVLEKAGTEPAKRVANWFASAVVATEEPAQAATVAINSDDLIELAKMVEGNELSSTAAKEVFNDVLQTGKAPRAIAEEKNLLQVSDTSAIEAIVDEVLADPTSAKAVADLRAGNEKVIGFLVGQIMKKSQGKANPALATELIKKKI